MDKLPNEILETVFVNLNFFQKQECMLVCRRWSNIIRSTSLFSTVFISTKGAFDSLIRILDNDPSYRPLVHTLIIKESVDLDLKKQQLLDYFPSLRYFQTGYFAIKRNNHLDTNTGFLIDVENWINQTEIIECHSRLRRSEGLLLSGVYPNLKRFSINGLNFPFDCAGIASSAPNINTLVVSEASISLNDLEQLNSGLKFLESLTLNKVTLVGDGQLNGGVLENSLQRLDINIQNPNDDLIVKWLQYISSNYLQIVDFRFVFPWTTGITFLQEESIVNKGLIPLLQNIGDQLKRLDITCSNGLKPVLQNLRVSKHVLQILHLHTIISFVRRPLLYLGDLGSFINQLTVTLNSTFRLKEFNLKELKMLRKLRIGRMPKTLSGYLSLSLNELLDSCPDSLDSLEIYDFSVNCSSTSCRSYSLRKLAIKSNSISKSVYSFIFNYLPSLKHLTLDQQSIFFIDNMVLKSKDLDYLELSMQGIILLWIKILNDGTSHCYRVGTYKGSDFQSTELNSIRSHDLVKWKAPNEEKFIYPEKTIELICNSVRTLIINKQLAF